MFSVSESVLSFQTGSDQLIIELFRFCCACYPLLIGRHVTGISSLYSKLSAYMLNHGIVNRIEVPLLRYPLIDFSKVFLSKVVPRFLKHLEGDLGDINYWRNRLKLIESDAQLVLIINEFVKSFNSRIYALANNCKSIESRR